MKVNKGEESGEGELGDQVNSGGSARPVGDLSSQPVVMASGYVFVFVDRGLELVLDEVLEGGVGPIATNNLVSE